MLTKTQVFSALLILIFSFITPNSFAQVEEIFSFYPDQPATNSGLSTIFHTGTDVVYMSVLNFDNGLFELWRSDGTASGTTRISDQISVRSQSDRNDFGYIDNAFYFYARPADGENSHVYKYDEITEELSLVRESEIPSPRFHMFVTGQHIYFVVEDGTCDVLWRSNRSGLTQVVFENPGITPANCFLNGDNDVIEVFNPIDVRYETYFKDQGGDLMRFTDGPATNMFALAGFSNQIDIALDSYNIFGRKFVFYGYDSRVPQNRIQGVYTFDLDTYELELLVESPNTYTNVGGSFGLSSPEPDFTPFIFVEGGFYFMHGEIDRPRTNQINNNILYFSDGTPEGTQPVYTFTDPQPNPITSAIADIRPQTIEGNKMIIRSNRRDDDAIYPEIYALDLISKTETELRDLFPASGDVFDAKLESFTAGFAFFDIDSESGPGLKLVTSDGTINGTEVQSTTNDDQNYSLIALSGLGIISDSLFVFSARVGENEQTSLMAFRYTCDGGECGVSNDGPGSFDLTPFYDESFTQSNLFDTNLPEDWNIIESTYLEEGAEELLWTAPTVFTSETVQYFASLDEPFFDENGTLQFRIPLPVLLGSEITEFIASPSISVKDITNFQLKAKLFHNYAIAQLPGIDALNIEIMYKDDNPEWNLLYTLDPADAIQAGELQGTSILSRSLNIAGDSVSIGLKATAVYNQDFFSFEQPVFFAMDSLQIFGAVPDSLINNDNDNPIDDDENLIYITNFDYDGSLVNPTFQLPQGWEYEQSEILSIEGIDSVTSWNIIPAELSGLEADMSIGESKPFDSSFFSDGILRLQSVFGQYNEQILSNIIDISNRDSIRIQANIAFAEAAFYTFPDYDLKFEFLYKLNGSDWDTLLAVGPSTNYEPNEFGSSDFFDGTYLRIDELLASVSNPSTLQFSLQASSNPAGDQSYAPTQGIVYIDTLKVTGISMVETSNEELTSIPDQIVLEQNYPNPFNPSTNISFTIPFSGEVRLEVFNLLGQSVAVIVDDRLSAGSHTLRFDGSGLSSGVYIYRLTGSDYSVTRKMLLIK